MVEEEDTYARIWAKNDLWRRVKAKAALEDKNIAEYATELLEIGLRDQDEGKSG